MKRKVLYAFTMILVVAGIFTLYNYSKDKKIERISGKPAGNTPLAAMPIREGVKLVHDDKIFLIGLRPKQGVLSVYPHPHTEGDKIIIDKDENLLYLYKSGDLYAAYPVATGKNPLYNPEGNFRIANKIANDRELNPRLGVRWMGLSVPRENDKRAHNDSRALRGKNTAFTVQMNRNPLANTPREGA